MIELQCPRCEQYWYTADDDDEGGRVRLCSRCVDQLRLKRGHRTEIDVPFLAVAGFVLFVDIVLMVLIKLMPAPFGTGVAVLGAVLFFGGVSTLRILSGQWWGGLGWWMMNDTEIDWRIGRWALLAALSGMALMGSAFALAKIRH